jgi:hypothetical protein
MMGFLVAAVTETLLPSLGGSSRGLFGDFHGSFFFSFGFFLVAASVALAASSTNRLGRQLLEAVITSLTSRNRSSGSVTNTNVDCALDSAFDAVFDNAFLMRNLLFDDLLVEGITDVNEEEEM